MMVGGFAVLTTFINGEGPFQMLVDTGAAKCAVRRSVALRAGLVAQRQVLLATMVANKIVSLAAAVVRVGFIEAPETEVLINDLPGLDGLESHVYCLLGQNFLAETPYLIDYRARRFWFGEQAIAKAQRLGPPLQVDLNSGRLTVPVAVYPYLMPLQLILDSGVDHLVLRCGNQCESLIEEHTVWALTNSGRMLVRKGRVPVVTIGSQKFFKMEASIITRPSDVNNVQGCVPASWFSAVYVNATQKLIRLAR